ncbi:hypothetical protein [Metabacillus indicus]|uniref:Uncharacterized protein n=1 Tax=Metabacillus indicus TaxID=246786 RepID=A0A084GJM0_METID|nr:hypothetical protein [Metabacillus indicus]KEZ47532.1 hypothetical protein GS18_0219265 [Metabacillus indicus]
MENFHNRSQLRSKYVTLFKVLRFKPESFQSTFLLNEDINDDEFNKDLLLAKKTEEITTMAFEWLIRNVPNISDKKWEARYRFLDDLNQHLIYAQTLKRDESNLTTRWNCILQKFIDQEKRLNIRNSKDIIIMLEKIKNLLPSVDTLNNAISNFGELTPNKKSENLYHLINDYYELLEKEMSSEQINVSYGSKLIIFLQTELLAKKIQKYNQNYQNPISGYEWILHQEHNHFRVTLQLCNYIKNLIGYNNSIIYKELKDDIENLDLKQCPFFYTEELINQARKKEKNQRNSAYSKKYKMDTINQKHLLHQFVDNLYKKNE